MQPKTKKEKADEQELRRLIELLAGRNLVVRREKLARGYSYRVKSGDCVLSGENLVFVDKRLPLEQQLSVIIDYLMSYRIVLDDTELEQLSRKTQSLLSACSEQKAA